MTKNYMKQFSDFDNADVFETILEGLKPHGFDDGSWRNDSCPSVGREIKDGDYISVFVDYKNPDLAEFPEDRKSGQMKVITIYSQVDDTTFQTDDTAEAVSKAIEIFTSQSA